MKILNFQQFCALPEGAIYSYYEPAICTGLYRKGGTISYDGAPHDFCEASLVPYCPNGDPPIVDSEEMRWGVYNEKQLFAVLDESDIQTIRDMLG